jgi:hypothetical protein
VDATVFLVFCDACGHQAHVDRSKEPEAGHVDDVPHVLRCSVCGAHEAPLCIAHTGAGGFPYKISPQCAD